MSDSPCLDEGCPHYGTPHTHPEVTSRISLCDGKYTYIRLERGGQYALRYNEPWRDLVGDGFVLAMAQRIEELEEQLKASRTITCDQYVEAADALRSWFEKNITVAGKRPMVWAKEYRAMVKAVVDSLFKEVSSDEVDLSEMRLDTSPKNNKDSG